MCVVSAVFDHWHEKWNESPAPFTTQPYDTWIRPPMPTAEEIAEFRRLLEEARARDIAEKNKGCEMEEKIQKLLDLAEELGIKDQIDIIVKEVLDDG